MLPADSAYLLTQKSVNSKCVLQRNSLCYQQIQPTFLPMLPADSAYLLTQKSVNSKCALQRNSLCYQQIQPTFLPRSQLILSVLFSVIVLCYQQIQPTFLPMLPADSAYLLTQKSVNSKCALQRNSLCYQQIQPTFLPMLPVDSAYLLTYVTSRFSLPSYLVVS